MDGKEYLNRLSPSLFWDMDISGASMDTCPQQVVQRVLEYGNLDDWPLIRDYYGLERIVEFCKQMRTLDRVCLSYICLLSGTSKEEYRCIIRHGRIPHFGTLEVVSYSWIDDVVEEDGIRLASDKDIAAMKISAIEGRGSKKDFNDQTCTKSA